MASLQSKIDHINHIFSCAHSPEEKYQTIISLGKKQQSLNTSDKIEQNRVHGCQSTTYLKTQFENGLLIFQIESDALISAGLGQLLVQVYSEESPETIIKNPPTYIENLDIRASLSPGRANGLASMWNKMVQQALSFLKSNTT